MKIKILKNCAGVDIHYRHGEVVDVDEGTAYNLIYSGIAEEIKEVKQTDKKRK